MRTYLYLVSIAAACMTFSACCFGTSFGLILCAPMDASGRLTLSFCSFLAEVGKTSNGVGLVFLFLALMVYPIKRAITFVERIDQES